MKIIQRLIDKLEKTHLLYIITFLVLLSFVTYFPSLFNSFVWDDEEQIANNVIIQNVSNIPFLFTSSTFNTGGGGLAGFYYKPLMPISFSINYFIWNDNAFGFHFFDLLLHIFNSILLFLFLKKFFSLHGINFSKSIAFLLALLFAVHPANTESVAYISSTQELLATFFILLATLSCLKFVKLKNNSFRIILLINLFILLSLLSKESGVISIPLVIILSFLYSHSKLKIITLSSSFTFIIYLLLRFPVAKTPILQPGSVVPIASASLSNRLLTVPFELFSYLRLIFFPIDLFIAQHMVIEDIADPRFYMSLLIVVLFLIAFSYIVKKNWSKAVFFFSSWIIFSFFLLLNIYPLDMTIAERWLYIPMIGVLGLAGILLGNLFVLNKKRAALILTTFILISIPIFSIRTFARTFDWKNNFTLFSHDIKYSKESFDAQNNLGVALVRANDFKNAKKHFEKSIELAPNWWTSYNNLGFIYQREGNIEKAKKLYQKSIENGHYYLAYENLAIILFHSEKPEKTLNFVKLSLQTLPNNETLNKVAAVTYIQMGATDSARPYAAKAYQIRPSQQNYFLLQSTLNIK